MQFSSIYAITYYYISYNFIHLYHPVKILLPASLISKTIATDIASILELALIIGIDSILISEAELLAHSSRRTAFVQFSSGGRSSMCVMTFYDIFQARLRRTKQEMLRKSYD